MIACWLREEKYRVNIYTRTTIMSRAAIYFYVAALFSYTTITISSLSPCYNAVCMYKPQTTHPRYNLNMNFEMSLI